MPNGIQNNISHYLCGIIRKFNFKVLLEDKFSVAVPCGDEQRAIIGLFLCCRELVHLKNKFVRQEEPNF